RTTSRPSTPTSTDPTAATSRSGTATTSTTSTTATVTRSTEPTMTSTDAPMRPTKQRLAVVQAMASFEDFRSAQEIHDLLRRRGEARGLATVYPTPARR